MQCRFTKHHILFLKITEYAFENQIAQLEQVFTVWKITLVSNLTSAPFQIADQSEAGDEETVELAVYHGLNLLAGYSKYPQRGWGQEGLHVLQACTEKKIP